jgi:hypothetical protein
MLREDAVKVKNKKKKKKKLFKLAAMEALVERNTFLQSKYDALSVNAEDKLGYHYNEVIHNILFNKYVKTNEDLMKEYYKIKKELDIEQSRQKSGKETDPSAHPMAPDNVEKQSQPEPQVQQAPVDPNAPIDTRLDEMETGDAGNYGYETPFFLFAGTQQELAKKWKANNKKAQNNMKIIIPNTETHTMGKESYKELNEEMFTNFEMAGDVFEAMVNEEKLPDALIRVNSVQSETAKDSKGYYKEVKATAESKDNIATGLNAESDSLSPDQVKKYVPDAEEEEFVKLERGNNEIDRAIQGLEKEPSKEQMDRYREQAGDDIVDTALEKKEMKDDLNIGKIQPVKVQTVNESAKINGKYVDDMLEKKLIIVDSMDLIETSTITESMAPINTLGMGNSYNKIAENLTESYKLYIDLECGDVYKVKKNNTLNESAKLENNADVEKMKGYFAYSPRKYERGK